MVDQSEPAAPEPAAADEVVVWGEDGRLLLAGEPAAIEGFLQTFEPIRSLDVSGVRGVADGVAALTAMGAFARNGARYVELTKDSAAKLAQHGPQHVGNGTIHSFVRGAGGRFAGNLKLKPVTLAGTRAVSVQLTVATAAIRLAIQETKDAVEEVAADVDALRQLAEAAEIGNVTGLYRVLANARAQADEDGTVGEATWDAIAVHEVTAQQGADRARALLRRVLQDQPLDRDAGERTEAVQRLVREQTVARALRLLLLAEQCRLLYRSLKLDRVRDSEPEAVGSEMRAAGRLLAENATADRELIAALHDTVSKLGHTGPLDGVRLLTRNKLPRLAGELHQDVEWFAQQRREQLDSWAPEPTPRVDDAARELAGRAYRGMVTGRDYVGRLVEGAGRRMQSNRDSGDGAG